MVKSARQPSRRSAGLPARVLRRLARNGRRLLPGIVLAAAIVPGTGLINLAGPWSILELLGLFGTFALFGWVGFAVLSVLFIRPFPSEGVAGSRPVHLLISGGVGCAVTVLVHWPALPLADLVVPTSLDIREPIIASASWGMAAIFGTAVSIVIHWRVQKRLFPLPLGLVGLQLTVWRLATYSDTVVFLTELHAFLDLTCLLALIALLSKQSESRPARLPWLRFVAPVGAVLAIVLAIGAPVILNASTATRANLSVSYSGFGYLLAAMRSLVDFDGDGCSALLGGMDCDDSDAEVGPHMIEIAGNGKDDNCIGGDLLRTAPRPLRRFVPRHAPRSVVLITIDAWRPDTLAAQTTDGRPLMEHVLQVARQGALFPVAYAQAPFTDLSMRSFLTGRTPPSFTTGTHFLGLDESLAELLAGQGYRTVCLQQVWLLNPHIYSGFQEVDDSLAERNADFHGRTSADMTDKALAAFARLDSGSQPFLLWVHYFDTHSAHDPIPGTPIADSSVRSRYEQEAWHTDRHLGRLLAALSQRDFLDRGYIVLAGDHGEFLGEGHRVGHAMWLKERSLRVPIIVAGPGVPAGVFETRVRLLDLFPTVLELAVGDVAESDGVTLSNIWSGKERKDRQVFAFTYYRNTNKRLAMDGNWVFIQDLVAGAEQLFEVSSGASLNLIDQRVDQADRMRMLLGRHIDEALNDRVARAKLRRLGDRSLPSQITEQ